jgi:predicted metal-dependent HD superfamily phosphohydrolase
VASSVEAGLVEKAMTDEFARRWRDTMQRSGADPGDAAPVLDELQAMYGEAGRHYHTLDHIVTLLRLLDVHGSTAADRDALELAIYFHDAVYDPLRSDNEAASAALAGQRLPALNLPAGLIAKVEQYILATRHNSGTELPDDADLALLLDLDLSILAAERSVYAGYAKAIRREYETLPDEVYRPGRKKVLSAFLARPQIYSTPALRALWEARARDNLAWEVGGLS